MTRRKWHFSEQNICSCITAAQNSALIKIQRCGYTKNINKWNIELIHIHLIRVISSKYEIYPERN